MSKKDNYRAFITSLVNCTTYGVPVSPFNNASNFTFDSPEAAKKAIETYLLQYGANFPLGYRAIVINMDTMILAFWGEKPTPPTLVWHGDF